MLSSEGPVERFLKFCIGVFEHDGGFSNGKPTFKHQTNGIYLCWSPKSCWGVSKMIEIKYEIKRQQQQLV